MHPWPHAVVAGVVLVLVAAATVPLTNVTTYTPENTVRRYLGAVADGDAAKAMALVNESSGDSDGETAAVTTQVLRAAPALPSAIEVRGAERVGDDRATVEASYYLDRSTRTTTFEVVRDSRFGGLWNHWQIAASSLPTVTVEAGGADTIQVNTIDVTVGSGRLLLLPPAVYSVGYSSAWLASEPTRLGVTDFGQEEDLPLVPEPTQAMIQEVSAQLDGYLQGCAEQVTLSPSGCPFSYGTTDEILGDVTWTLGAGPTVRLEAGDDGFLMPAARGRATVSGRARDIVTAEERDFEEEVEYYLGATVATDGDQLRVIPRESLLGS